MLSIVHRKTATSRPPQMLQVLLEQPLFDTVFSIMSLDEEARSIVDQLKATEMNKAELERIEKTLLSR